MSKLEADAAAFKRQSKAVNFASWHSQPKPPVLASSSASTPTVVPGPDEASGSPTSKKNKRPKTNIVYSQPADTGTGNNVNTQLVYAVSFMKGKQGPMRIEDIALMTETPIDTDPVLREKFKMHDKIQFDPKTNPLLLQGAFQRSTKKGSGLSVRVLKESWKEAPAAIEELEKEGEVLVTRTQKDGQLRMVFWNRGQAHGLMLGGKRVDQEFLDLWHELKVPNEVDLQRELANEGLQVTSTEAAVPKATNTKKKGKKGGAPRQRQVRITNTHLRGEIDLSRDYVAPGK
ncbi:transcription initiation factor IIE subunit beta [Coprinellus micaceus]|uniref:Transcription initiation factor IIE subunit beta n=1 Tax=Coprinellus micaceus TaxID=71717 RepID=A0A4Y7TI34_COPMI|nr:transcription initiation factor IIE subunit beta [Coprinellus micaceus]